MVNRLGEETSPYLRQHADNPVPWLPWGDEAFALARADDKPLFISIGYASCHWCHVMAHESFEDPEIAALLEADFVAVKIDREERPDIDALYMAATQALTGSGGWPMSVFCTPDGRPFFAGTYYPPEDRHGLPSFRRVLGALSEAWSDRRDEVERQADALSAAVSQQSRLVDDLAASAGPLDAISFDDALGAIVADLATGFDEQWGGFGPAPKFPRPTLLEFLLIHHQRTGDPQSLAMTVRTLDAMATGGIYDHLIGGFCRYATDRTWLVPHFEKMLTDQALLARGYLHAYQVTGRHDYLQVVTETLDYVVADLGAPGGGSSRRPTPTRRAGRARTRRSPRPRCSSALADDTRRADQICDWYDITPEGNWEGVSMPRRPLGATLARSAEVDEDRGACWPGPDGRAPNPPSTTRS